MNTTNLTQILIETINQTKTVIGQGADFAKEQIPLVVNEFLLWNFWSDIGIMILLFISAFIFFKVCKWAINKVNLSRDEEPWILLAILAGIGIIPCLIGAFVHGFDAMKIKVAPRVYIIEYVHDALTEPRR